MRYPMLLRRFGPAFWAAVVLVLSPGARGGEPILKGYADYETYRKQLESIAGSRFASMRSLGRTLGGREVYLLEIGVGKRDEKPAILVVGGVYPPHLVGSELAVRLARRLVDQAAGDKAVAAMLERVTFYVIPRPSPDACEALFRRPYWERAGNERPTDDDHDGLVDEDGPDDLNGDGLITMMRVEDPAGTHMPHPKDPRVLVRADREKNQRGRWLVYSEGTDNDKDGEQSEDPPGGTEFNRNFPFRYPYFQRGAGPHQVSEVETRAVADFCFNHTNIAAVLSFTPEDNLMRPWKPNPAAESQRIKTSVLGADAPYFDYVAEQYRGIHGGKDAPESPPGQGSFSEWAYFHYGRWSFACRGWWIPQTGAPDAKTEPKPGEKPGQSVGWGVSPSGAGEPAEAGADAPAYSSSVVAGLPTEPPAQGTVGNYAPEEAKPGTKPPSSRPEAKGPFGRGRKPPAVGPERRADEQQADAKQAAEDLSALRWFAEKKIDGFVDWKPVAHPDFPGRRVEVGGFKPLVRLNPPAEELEPLAERHWRFLRRLAELLPDLAIEEVKTEPLGEGVWRVTALVVNRGYLPTVSAMGRMTNSPLLLQAAIELPTGASLVTGHPRVQLPTLPGNGGKAEPKWLVRTEPGKEAVLTLRAWCASVGSVTKSVKVKGGG
jgi:hypothetical protein